MGLNPANNDIPSLKFRNTFHHGREYCDDTNIGFAASLKAGRMTVFPGCVLNWAFTEKTGQSELRTEATPSYQSKERTTLDLTLGLQTKHLAKEDIIRALTGAVALDFTFRS